jgi:hypothetical protein
MQNSTAQALAEQFSALNRSIIAWVEGCSDAQWQHPCGDDTRTVGLVAHHIGSAYPQISQLVGLVASGQQLPALTEEMFHQGNAQHAAAFAGCTQKQVSELLATNGEAAAAAVRLLSQEQLERSGYFSLLGTPVQTQGMIEHVLIGHTSGHFADIQSAVAS